MNVTCKDRDRILEDGTAAGWIGLGSDAATCGSCADELRGWKFLSLAAAELRDYTESPALWPRIHQALAEQADAIQKQRDRWSWRSLFPNFSLSWQSTAATAFVVVLMVSAGWVLRVRREPPIQQGSLLRSKALTEVEHAESAYVQAIDKLAGEPEPQLENPATSLMANYR